MLSSPRVALVCTALSLFALVAGCNRTSAPVTETKHPTKFSLSSALFRDVASKSNLKFAHDLGNNGHFYFDEFTPPGCAFFDFDGDGDLDVFLVQSGSSAPAATVKNRPFCALYRNKGDGTFEDVTRGSGVDKDLGYGQGVAVGDFDHDGFDDLFVTSYGANHLLRNVHGTGKFEDVTHGQGLDKPSTQPSPNDNLWATSSAWGDYDNDGRLDLYVCYYAKWSPALDKPCRDATTGLLDYCEPKMYPPVTHRLYHNTGHAFEDVSAKSGINKGTGRGLAVTFVDFNEDGKQDIFVANDGVPILLWKNNGDGTFKDVATQAGCAYDGQGHGIAGMSVSVADYNRSGRGSVYVSNFSATPNILFRNEGGLFSDATQEANLGFSHLNFLSFGSEFFDYDADGWPDLIDNNGHVQMRDNKRAPNVALKQRKQLIHNEGNGRFKEVADASQLGDLNTPVIGRGLATGDFDNDGRVDVLAMSQNGPVQLFRNGTGGNGNHFVSFALRGTKSNTNAIGAKLKLDAGGAKQTAWVRSGSSFLSSSDRRVFFGLGKTGGKVTLRVFWPSGTRQTLRNLEADSFYSVQEDKGVTAKHQATR